MSLHLFPQLEKHINSGIHSEFEVHDTLRHGITTQRKQVKAKHPLDCDFEKQNLLLKMELETRIYGSHMALRRQMEQTFRFTDTLNGQDERILMMDLFPNDI